MRCSRSPRAVVPPPPPGSAVLALLLAGYLAQQYLPAPAPKVIGVDLGTTYCAVGVFLPGTGRVKVIADGSGRHSIPSVVSFTGSGVRVGYEGLELADADPQNTIYDAKRFIGKVFTPEELESESSRYPFKVSGRLHRFSASSSVCKAPASNQRVSRFSDPEPFGEI